ncbi:hypothetical protein D3C71_1353130 [compost metagenome]
MCVSVYATVGVQHGVSGQTPESIPPDRPSPHAPYRSRNPPCQARRQTAEVVRRWWPVPAPAADRRPLLALEVPGCRKGKAARLRHLPRRSSDPRPSASRGRPPAVGQRHRPWRAQEGGCSGQGRTGRQHVRGHRPRVADQAQVGGQLQDQGRGLVRQRRVPVDRQQASGRVGGHRLLGGGQTGRSPERVRVCTSDHAELWPGHAVCHRNQQGQARPGGRLARRPNPAARQLVRGSHRSR